MCMTIIIFIVIVIFVTLNQARAHFYLFKSTYLKITPKFAWLLQVFLFSNI